MESQEQFEMGRREVRRAGRRRERKGKGENASNLVESSLFEERMTHAEETAARSETRAQCPKLKSFSDHLQDFGHVCILSVLSFTF